MPGRTSPSALLLLAALGAPGAGAASAAADTSLYTLQSWPAGKAGSRGSAEAAEPGGEDLISAYGQMRSAAFGGWGPTGIYILTRMGTYPQLHSLSAPLADRRQRTFFKRRMDQWYMNPVAAKRQALVAFDNGGDEDFSLRLLDLGTGRTRPLACPPGRVTSVIWNDSGTAFLYSHTPPGTDRWDIRMGSPEGRDTLLLSRPGTWLPMDWTPDGGKAVVQHYVSASQSELHTLSLPGGEVTRLLPADPPQYFDHAAWVRLRETGSTLPETGKTMGLAFTSDRDGAGHRLYLLRAGEDEPIALTSPGTWDVEWVAAGGDRRTLVYSVNEQGVSVLHALKPGVTPYSAMRLAGIPKGIIEGVTFHPSGKEFGFTVNGSAFPGEAFTYRLGGPKTAKAVRWTESETAGLPREGFREPELVFYPTFDSVPRGKAAALSAGGAAQGASVSTGTGMVPRLVPAWLYSPAPGNGPAPVLVSIHGGPEQQARAGFDPFTQYLVAQMKVAVLLPNVRGSTGYGREYQQADDGFKRLDAVRDIGALLDWIGTRPDLDPTRVAVAGRSYGGFMSLAALARHGDKIQAAVSTVGITHFPTFLKETSGYRRDLRRAEYGDERDARMAAFLDSISPARQLDRLTRLRRPVLLAHGRNDPRVPYAESVRLFEALKSRQTPAWLLTFNREGHAFRSEASQTAYSRVLAEFLAQQFRLPAPP